MRLFRRRQQPVDAPEIYLVHAALAGPVPLSSGSVPPLTEDAMPAAWRGLSDDAQERALRVVWQRSVGWALARGVDEARIDAVMADPVEQAEYDRLADRVGRRWAVYTGRDRAERVLYDAFPKPVELQALVDGTVVLEVYETWDGILVHSDSPPDIDTRP